MGLFVAQDGRYQGWLAALLCCIAAVGDDEYPIEKEQLRPTTSICQQHPITLTALPSIPTARDPVSIKGERSVLPSDGVRAVPAQAPSLKPLELGNSLLRTPRPTQWRPESSLGDHTHHTGIGAPTSFRRVEHTDSQRASLVPLRLGPVVLSNPSDNASTTPTSTAARPHLRSDSTQGLMSQSKRESYRAQGDAPFQRCHQSSTTALSTKTSASSLGSGHLTNSLASPAIQPSTNRTRISRASSSNSLHRQALETRAASSERIPLKRKRSLQNVRKSSAEHGEAKLEKEVLELNTIVEERRTDPPRPQGPPPQHVAAVAPTMEVRARKETLNDIGSALARPFTARESSHMNTIFDSPDKPRRPSTSRASSRVSGWLSGLLPTLSTATPPAPNHHHQPEPFYKCVPPPTASTRRPRPASSSEVAAASPRSSLASDPDDALNAPSLTAASSPTTKGHSRSLTAESRLTPLSPPSMIYGQEMPPEEATCRKGSAVGEHWLGGISESQVGLAF
ncbi:hypothetical protein B0A55_03914 [Friedmanniomyces simplex]|uniref:Uncharacterized protein n=1 Tax=Friedmanniomyces simplex TaxID=329884 RepID=A0A4U0XNG0_9PEZI|nr:hypothetical protein B0A55_03914 [Friedmanniomyces simplex]